MSGYDGVVDVDACVLLEWMYGVEWPGLNE